MRYILYCLICILIPQHQGYILRLLFTVLQESPKMPQRKSMMSRRVRPQSVIGKILIVYTSVLECVTLY